MASEKEPFSVLLRPAERAVLRHLAETMDRSAGATVRLLIREEAQKRGLWPLPAAASTPSAVDRRRAVGP
jgi:hypothetical protein